jgi:chromosome partitioning protein
MFMQIFLSRFLYARKGGVIISVCNQKGGSGKTTTAVNLAACCAEEGIRTLLIDSDEQHSALAWKADRPEGLPEVTVIGLPVSNLLREVGAFSRDYGIVIIDGGGRITNTARLACRAADFLVIPTRPSKPDILSTREFLEKVVEEVRAIKPVTGGILITQMQGGTVVGKAAVKEIEQLGYPYFEAVIHNRVAYQEAMAAGMSVVEYDRASKAALETLAFFAELKEAW